MPSFFYSRQPLTKHGPLWLRWKPIITVTSYGTFQGSGLGNREAPGHDPSMTGCTGLSLYFIGLSFVGFPLSPTNMKNVVDGLSWGCLRYCRHVQGTGDGTEVFHDVATDFMIDVGLLKTVSARATRHTLLFSFYLQITLE